MERKIINIESASVGKRKGHNDDDIYIGENFVAVIDGVSFNSSITVNGNEIKIAQIITEAIRKIDRQNAPIYAKTLNFNEFSQYINMYIKKYLEGKGYPESVGKLEATGAIFSKYRNQVWIVGDCRAIYDGEVITNPLRTDGVVEQLRIEIVKALLEEGYSEESLVDNDVSTEIIIHPEKISEYIKSPETIERIETYRRAIIKDTLLKCGFSEEEIEKKDLVKEYYNPRDIQAFVKNNPNANEFGYSIFNGEYTEPKNCKVVDLPKDVKTIKLFSDGFKVEELNNNKDVGYAIRLKRRHASSDILSMKTNISVNTAKPYKPGDKIRAIDDASVVVIEIKQLGKEDNERE